MAQRIVGLDVGARQVKAVLLESSYRAITVVDAAAEPVPAPDEAGGAPLRERQAAALQALLRERGWTFEAALAALPGPAATHAVDLPFSDPRRIEQTIGFEIEAQIPFALEDVAFDWQVLSSAPERTDLLVGVVRKEELSGFLAALAGAGVDPRAVLPAGPAYAALWAAGAIAPLVPPPSPEVDGGDAAGPAPASAEPPAEAIVDLGHARTSFCVVQGGRCEAARTIASGAADVARSLGSELGIGEADAERILLAAAAGQEAPPQLAAASARAEAAIRRALLPVARELRATLKAWRARRGQRPLARLLLAGELARLPGLAELLRPEAEGPVEPLELAGPAAERITPEAAPGMALALALALRGHQGSRGPRMNLRRGALAYTRDFEHFRGRLVRIGVYAALVLLLAGVSSGVKVFALARQEALLDRSLCEVTRRLVGKCYDDFDVAVSVLKGKGTPSAAIPRISAVDILAELSHRAPPGVPYRLDRIEITREKIHLQGTTDAAENVDKVVSALRGSRCFGEARSGGARKRSADQKFEFSVDSELSCDVGGSAGGKG